MSYFEFPHTRTYDSDLGWLIKTVKELTEAAESLNDWRIQHEEEYKQLKALYDALNEGNNAYKFHLINVMQVSARVIETVIA